MKREREDSENSGPGQPMDNDYEVVDSIETLHSKVASLKQQLDAAAQRHRVQLTDRNRVIAAMEEQLRTTRTELDAAREELRLDIAKREVKSADVERLKGELSADCTLVDGWYLLSEELGKHENVVVNGRRYTKSACDRMSIEVYSPRRATTYWSFLGRWVKDHDEPDVEVDGIHYTMKQCFEKAVDADPLNWYAWGRLSNMLPNDQPTTTIDVNGTAFTKKGLLAKVAEVKPMFTSMDSWYIPK